MGNIKAEFHVTKKELILVYMWNVQWIDPWIECRVVLIVQRQ
jgi:hypothetical protein